MYFIPSNNKLLNFLAYKKPWQWYSITASILVCITGAWVCVLFFPHYKKLANIKSQISQLNSVDTKKNHQDYEQLTQTIADAQSRLDAQLPATDQAIIEWMTHTLRDLTLELLACEPQKIVTHDWYDVHHVHMKVRGTFGACMNFLNSLTSAPSVLNSLATEIKKVDESTITLSCLLSWIVVHNET